jgi:RNA polymerase sigma-70 factor (ECF subfamily)
MTGDPAEAEDATQETFLRAFERFHLLDPERDEVAWVHVVATRVVLNRLRAARPRRRALEAVAAAPATPAPEEPAVERREREETVARHVAGLPPDERAAVVLEYYVGLPPAKVAEALDVPRTTAQSRVARALASLRASLSSTGVLAGMPLEDVLRGTPAPPVPASLTRSLLDAARAAAGSASAAPVLVIGGLAVTKTAALAAAVVAALALLGGGYAVGRAVAAREDVVPAESVSAAEHARLVEENARLREDAARRLAVAPTPRAAEGRSPGASPAGGEAAGMGATADAAAPAAGEAVDWGKFAKAWADSADLLLDVPDDSKATPEQKQRLMGVLVAFQDASLRAQALSPTPFFDERVLPGLVGALFAAPLELTPEARAALDASVRTALRQSASDVAAAQGRPVALFEARQRVIDQVLEGVRGATPAAARERGSKMEKTTTALLTGDHEMDEFGVDPSRPQGFSERVAQTWRARFGLEDSQDGAVRSVADAFGREAIDAWRRHGLDREGAVASPEEQRAFEREVLRAQVAAERALEPLLTPAQREKWKSMPRLFRPRLGGDASYTTMGGGI